MATPKYEDTVYKEFMAVPENRVAEILNGTLVTHPRPAPKHTRASSVLGGKLGDKFDYGEDGPGGWVILDEPELHLGSDILVPDLAGWREENMQSLPETAYFGTPPDWLCEVLSPSTARYDKLEKRDIYAAHKVQYLWFVDPEGKTLEAFELQGGNWVLLKTFAHAMDVDAAPFGAVPFALRSLWFE